MREKLPSATAAYVAFTRAFASHDPVLSGACQDPYAESLLPPQLSILLRAVRHGPAGVRVGSVLRALSLGLFDHIALRTALIDSAVAHAVEEGIDQVVLLGAGLDARAHRLEVLSRAVVYELDRAASQDVKRAGAARLPLRARALRYAPCDFERSSPAEALSRAGFESARRTLWVWEGVTMYLTCASVRTTLAQVATLSAEGSLLVLTYLTPELVVGGERLGALATRALALLSEPIRCTLTPEQMADELALAGFELVSDASPTDAAPHFEVTVQRPSSLMPTERIAIAIKRGK